MLSLEANRLQRRWRILTGVLVLFVAFVAMPVRIAYATNLGTAPQGGYYAVCNTWWQIRNAGGGGASNWHLEGGGLCNTGNVSGWTAAIAVGLSGGTFGSDGFATGSGLTSSSTLTACPWPGNSSAGAYHSANQTFQFNVCANVADGSGLNPPTAVTGVKICFENGGTFASYSGATFTAAHAGTRPECPIATNSGTNGRIDIVGSDTGYSKVNANTQYPADFFTGGTAGPTLDANKGTSSCSRTLTDTNAMTGEFTAGRTGLVNATVTGWDWDWGDSTTHGTAQNMNHTYGALSTMPNGGWTSTVTMTVTATSGHLFSDGTSSQTGTCQLRVDFLHPEDMTPGSTGSSGTGTPSLDSCIPSGWNVLNPIALIGGMGCLLQTLFVPSSTTTNGLGHLWDTVTTHLPFSVVTGFVDYIPNMWSDFKWQLENVSPLTTSHELGGVHDPSPLCTQTKGGDMPNGSPLNLCPGPDTMPFQSIAGNSFVTLLRSFFLFVLVAIFVYAMWRGANEILQ